MLATTSRRALGASLVALVALAACGGTEPAPRVVPRAAAPRDPSWLADVARTCTKVASCAHAHDAPRLRDPGACVEWWIQRGDPKEPEPLLRCLASAATCEQIQTCIHGGGDGRAAAFCAQRPGVVSGCDGDRFVACGDDDGEESTVKDCAALGATCRELRSPGGLVLRGCFSAQKCPPGAPEARCDGAGAVLSCHDGIVERVPCRAGTTCEEHKDDNAEATASCTLRGKARCEALGAKRCDGDRLVECTGQGHFGRVRVSDCAASGLRCTGVGPRAACYVPSSVECDKDMLPKCEGGAVVFCAAGRLSRVSCAAIGMGPCDPAARGAVVACTAPGAPAAKSP